MRSRIVQYDKVVHVLAHFLLCTIIAVPRQPTRRTSDCVAASPVDPLTTLVEDQRALIEEVRGLRAEQQAQTQELQALRCAIEKACISVIEHYDA